MFQKKLVCTFSIQLIFEIYFYNISVNHSQYYWWRKRKYQEKTTKLLKAIGKLYHIKYTSSSLGFELTTFVLIGTACIGSCKSNYHTIMTIRLPVYKIILEINLSQTGIKFLHFHFFYLKYNSELFHRMNILVI